MKLSARNQIKGSIVEIVEGSVNGVVKLDIGGGHILTAIISMASIRELGLSAGSSAYAIIKASSVMLATD